jgi:hypothetical protein
MDEREMRRLLAGGYNPWLMTRRNVTFESYAAKQAPATARRLLDEAGLDPADYGLTIRAALGMESPEVEAGASAAEDARQALQISPARWLPGRPSRGGRARAVTMIRRPARPVVQGLPRLPPRPPEPSVPDADRAVKFNVEPGYQDDGRPHRRLRAPARPAPCPGP